MPEDPLQRAVVGNLLEGGEAMTAIMDIIFAVTVVAMTIAIIGMWILVGANGKWECTR